MTKSDKITEDTEVIINCPYNSLKEVFDTKRFKVKVFKDNGDKPFIIIREREEPPAKELKGHKGIDRLNNVIE